MSEAQQQFAIRSIYVKDFSFEATAPQLLMEQGWNPDAEVDLSSNSKPVELEGGEHYEVSVKIKATAKYKDKTSFIVECEYAGIFLVENFADEQLDHMLKSFCPNMVFPYLREAISEMTSRGGFAPLYLNPVNFDAIYAQNKEKEANEAGQASDQAES